MARIKLPNNWQPRDFQLPLWNYLANGGKRAIAVWHRRAGKDDVALHNTACQAIQRPGNYWHMLPDYSQARKAIWEAINPRTGKRRIDEAFPPAIRSAVRSQEMMIKLKNGSTWQLIGSDNYNSLVGSPPVGVIFSEYAIADPKAWGYLRPILADNNGWAIFITTPRGKNHAYDLFKHAETDDNWFSEIVTATQSGVFDPLMLENERRELIAEMGPEEGDAFFRQEYMCSFEGSICGSYYGSLIDLADADGRIGNVPYDAALPVITSWDLGVGDATGIWFFQVYGNEIRVIDYFEASGEGLPFYAKYLNSKPYVYGEHIMPHDIRVRELGSGKSRYETAQSLGIKPITIAPSLPIDDGINAVRSILSRCYFDRKKTEQGLNYIRSYRKEYDDKRKEYKNRPYHDFTSHACLPEGTLITTSKGMIPVEDVKVNDSVLIPTGEYAFVTNSGISGLSDTFVEITTSGGKKLTCTLNHKLLTDCGVVEANELCHNDLILKNGGLLWSIITFGTTASDIISAACTTSKLLIQNLQSSYIDKFGKITTARYRKIMSCITRIKTVLTTELKILNSCYAPNTRLIMEGIHSGVSQNETSMLFYLQPESSRMSHEGNQKTEQETEKDGRKTQNSMSGLGLREQWSRFAKQLRLPENGTLQKKENSGILNTANKRGSIENQLVKIAKYAVKSTTRFILLGLNSAERVVSLNIILLEKKQPVYNLTVEKHHCYLANGLLVSNSDAFRMFAVGYKDKVKSKPVSRMMERFTFKGVW